MEATAEFGMGYRLGHGLRRRAVRLGSVRLNTQAGGRINTKGTEEGNQLGHSARSPNHQSSPWQQRFFWRMALLPSNPPAGLGIVGPGDDFLGVTHSLVADPRRVWNPAFVAGPIGRRPAHFKSVAGHCRSNGSGKQCRGFDLGFAQLSQDRTASRERPGSPMGTSVVACLFIGSVTEASIFRA